MVAESLPWPAGAETWTTKELELFIGSGGFLKPKKKAPAPAPAPAAPAAPVAPSVSTSSGYAAPAQERRHVSSFDRWNWGS